MPMLKNLGLAIDSTLVTALPAVALGETPFFPGANAVLNLSAPIGGAGVMVLEGSDTLAGTYTTLNTINAAAGTMIEVLNLPKFIRLRRTVAGTGTIAQAALEGVQ